MWKLFGILILCLAVSVAYGQEKIEFFGRVTDTAGMELGYSTVLVINEDSTRYTIVTDSTGHFTCVVKPVKYFVLRISHKGYLDFMDDWIPKNVKNGKIEFHVILRRDYKYLEPVYVSHSRSVVISGDTVSYNVLAYPVRDGSMVEDILRRLPGVEVDMDGTVYVQGKKLEKVMVNGKEFFGGDVLLAIKNLPADVVARLQVIDDYGDKARLTGVRVGDPEKMLNIELCPDKKEGIFGHGQAGTGEDSKYASEVFANRFRDEQQISTSGSAADNSQTGVNPSFNAVGSYADKWGPKTSWGLNGATGGDNPRTSTEMTQKSYFPGAQLSVQQNSQVFNRNRNLGGGGVIRFKPDGQSTLRLTPSVSVVNASQRSVVYGTTLEQDSLYSKSTNSQSETSSSNKTANIGTDIYYERTLPTSKRRLSIQGNVVYTTMNENTDQQTSTRVESDSIRSYIPLHYLINNGNPATDMTLQGKYFFPIGATNFLEIGYNWQSLRSSSRKETQSLDSATHVLSVVDSLTSVTRYNTYYNQVYAGMTGGDKGLTWSVNVAGQPGGISGTVDQKGRDISYRYFAIFPHLDGTWRVSPTKAINFSYRGSNNLPSLQQINPVTDVTNPQFPVSGNPGLKPSYTHSIALGYQGSKLKATQFSEFGAVISYAVTLEPIIAATSHPNDSSQVIQATTYENVGRLDNLSLAYHFTAPAIFQKHLKFEFRGVVSKTKSPSMTDGVHYTSTTYTCNQDLRVQLMIPGVSEFNMEGNYSINHTLFPISTTLPASIQAASLSVGAKQYFLKRFSISGNLSEIYTDEGHGLSPSQAQFRATLQCDLFRHNMGSLILTGYNLLNNTNGASQSISATSSTTIYSNFIGRYFLLSFLIKFQRFH